ncbi:hypothetical protein PENARI_c001G11926 [Penicillium arizonense]|uniref:Uncharacterized protein n=1 Tax=Penicillium arizonense TaxID=1835702 RepID=A0A1F5LZM2_PENAI|nr:hypothetical protein PENARI_c001G11926 [Penicillium arizonense]OGE58593.1 hypothetical protein PENARI_c001G11926 [Penicillium arizonense]
MTGAELEFTLLSISERYKPYKEITEYQCARGYSELELRGGTKDCFAKLRATGFTVSCLTTRDTKRL